VTLAFPKQGKLSPAGRAVAQVIQDLVRGWGQQLTEP
jgi:LysR family transcriptional regulator, nitrogen assimilation regulatory protein